MLNSGLTFGSRRIEVGGIGFAIGVAGTGMLAAYELANGHEKRAVALCLLPLLALLVARPTVLLVALGASLPAVMSIGAQEYSGGYKYAVSDVLLVLIAAGVAADWLLTRSQPIGRALRPVALPLFQYAAVMVLVLTFHPDLRDLLKTGQRFELFVLPLVVGAFAALTGWHIRTLQAYVVATSIVAVVWPLDHFRLQHNPTGQFIANAILLLLGVRALRRFTPLLLLLVPGLILTVSRGAILATAIGALVILVLQRRRVSSVVALVLPAALLAVAAFALAPSSLQTRLTTFSAGTSTPAQYAIYVRHQEARDAHRIINAHPWTGVGIGNYLAADSKITAYPSQDPHQVLLLQEAEGGYLLAASFILLVGGALVVLARYRALDLAPAAAGVLLATVAHGFVDVYWVRGTPVLGWLLVGMACGRILRHRSGRGGLLVDGLPDIAPGSSEARPVHAVVVAFEAPRALERALRTLNRHVPATVVDNSASPAVRAVAERWDAEYVDPGRNLGFGAGVNIALKELVEGPPCDVLLLNPDATLAPRSLRRLEEYLHAPGNERVAAVAPRLIGSSGSDQRVAWPFPSPGRMWAEAVGLGHLPSRHTFVIGAVLLIRWEALQDIGLFDERFFLYSEEADWERRAAERGWRCIVCPEAVARHVGGGTSTDPRRRQVLFHAAQETYIRKWHGESGWFAYRLAAFAGASARALFLHGERRREAARRARLYLRGPRRSDPDG